MKLTLFCCNLGCFVAEPFLSRFTHILCGEKISQKFVRGEKICQAPLFVVFYISYFDQIPLFMVYSATAEASIEQKLTLQPSVQAPTASSSSSSLSS